MLMTGAVLARYAATVIAAAFTTLAVSSILMMILDGTRIVRMMSIAMTEIAVIVTRTAAQPACDTEVIIVTVAVATVIVAVVPPVSTVVAIVTATATVISSVVTVAITSSVAVAAAVCISIVVAVVTLLGAAATAAAVTDADRTVVVAVVVGDVATVRAVLAIQIVISADAWTALVFLKLVSADLLVLCQPVGLVICLAVLQLGLHKICHLLLSHGLALWLVTQNTLQRALQ